MDTLGARLKQIETLAFEHFRDEEGLMELSHYPLLGVHRAEHELIVERCHEGFARFAQPGSMPLSVMLEGFLVMFEYHIQKIDMDFVTYLNQPNR
jgi:hemerythrin-like metal-binding protein